MTTTIADGNGLFRAIIDDPRDEVARAVLCDWLQDQGDPVALERLSLMRSGVEIWAKNTRMNELRRHEKEASAGWLIQEPYPHSPLCRTALDLLHQLRLPLPSTAVIRRGFVDEVGCELAAWQRHGPAIVGAHPVTLVKVDRKPDLEEDSYWYWYFYDPADERDSLPTWLRPEGAVNVFEVRFRTEDEALDWLRRRLARWARKEAGLGS